MTWRQLPEERTVMYSPAWLRPVDTFTRGLPIPPLQVVLHLFTAGSWVPTDLPARTTPSGVITYPGLGRSRDPFAVPRRRYQVRFASGVYRPLYRATRDGEEFVAAPYSDTTPPLPLAEPVDVELAPSAGYPFPSQVGVLRGVVVTAAGAPVRDALVAAMVGGGVLPTARLVRTVTGERGDFLLPVRWFTAGSGTDVEASDLRSSPVRRGVRTVVFPQAFERTHRIVIS
jgi:hypothetical protein